MKWKVAITLGTIILVVSGLFAFLGLTIVNSKGCNQLVIDTNELHSGIDIPSVDLINCYFDEQEKTRVSIYKLELNDYYMGAYPGKFTSIDMATFPGITELEISEQPTTNRLYGISGTKWGNEWKYVVEPETRMLWVEIVYD
ncbi:MAG: hypothetical protein GVY07_02625 [Bacteroidetes bacterium]|jgi:hypothetical protein|nr:hypothetical protein [Bacteroidota bacterium]